MMHCWSYGAIERPTAAALHEEIDQLLHDMETGNENNLYIMNNHPTTKNHISNPANADEPILTRNPTIPPKKFPRVSLLHTPENCFF